MKARNRGFSFEFPVEGFLQGRGRGSRDEVALRWIPTHLPSRSPSTRLSLLPFHLSKCLLSASPTMMRNICFSTLQYKMGMVPQQFMALPPPNGTRPPYEQRGSTGYGLMGINAKKQHPATHYRETATPPACFPAQKNNALLTVRSAATLNVQPVGAQQIELETCQTAMARQVSYLWITRGK